LEDRKGSDEVSSVEKRSFIRWCRERTNHLLSHPRLTDGDKTVGVEIINRANWETGGYAFRAKALAVSTGRTARSVQRSVRKLVAEGLLTVAVNRGRTHQNYYSPLPAWTGCTEKNTTQESHIYSNNTDSKIPCIEDDARNNQRTFEEREDQEEETFESLDLDAILEMVDTNRLTVGGLIAYSRHPAAPAQDVTGCDIDRLIAAGVLAKHGKYLSVADWSVLED
jgi:hypothetical protein